jgi:serine/threonine protein kinase
MTAPTRTNSPDALKDNLRKAGKDYAAKIIKKTFEKSQIIDNAANFPKFSKSELSLGKILGKGGFGTVYEVRGFEAGKPAVTKRNSTGNLDAEDKVGSGEMESRKFIADHCICKRGNARYAAKFLSPEVIANPPTFIQGIMDMATETRVLSDIEHPNIIKMRACGAESPFDESYFIVMDRLYDTLESRIVKWGNRSKRYSGIRAKLFDRKGEKKKDILEEKLVAAFDLSAAIGHLHSRRIIYRDLKPENIGFDCVSFTLI